MRRACSRSGLLSSVRDPRLPPSRGLVSRLATRGGLVRRRRVLTFGGVSIVARTVFVVVGTGLPPGGEDSDNGSIIAFAAPAAAAGLSARDRAVALAAARGH